MKEETTELYQKPNTLLYRYFEIGHTCGIKVKHQNIDRRIKCNCYVRYEKIPRLWARPILKLKERIRLIFFKLKNKKLWIKR